MPCCRPQKDLFLPTSLKEETPTSRKEEKKEEPASEASQELPKPSVSEENAVQSESQPMEVDKAELESPVSPQEPTKPPQSSQRPQPSKLLELGDDLPEDMEDQVPYALQRRLEKCHQEGFIECVREHVGSMVKCNKRS